MVGFTDALPQKRVTVFFRIILMIPHAFVLWILGIVAEVIAIIGWFGALFTGRLPDFAADFLTGYVRWQTRYNAYYLLLTDEYPPFTLEDADYPVRVLTRPGRHNRLAVFFRLILGIPALFITSLLGFGLIFISLFVIWLIVLFTGSMPRAAHQALSAVTRYFARVYGYMLLLTSEYPKGLFGDGNEPVPSGGPWAGPGDQTVPPSPGVPASPAPPAPPAAGPAAAAPTMPQPASTYQAPGQYQGQGTYQPAGAYQATAPYQAPGAYQAAAPGPAAPGGNWPGPGPGGAARHELSWRLALSDTAKRLIGLFLVLGVLGLIAYIVIIVVAVSGGVSTAVTRQNAINQVQADNATLSKTLTPLASKTAACQSSSDPLHCITALDRNVGRAFHSFASGVRSTDMPTGSATAAAGKLAGAADQAGNVFQRLGTAQTAEQYQSIVSSSDVERIVGQVGLDYQELGSALNATQ